MAERRNQAPRFDAATYKPRPTSVIPDALLSSLARCRPDASDLSSRAAPRTAATSTSVLSTTQTVPMTTSCTTTEEPAEQELRQEREKEQCGLDVERLDQDALQQSPARARGLGSNRCGSCPGQKQADAEVDQVGRADVLDEREGHGRLSQQHRQAQARRRPRGACRPGPCRHRRPGPRPDRLPRCVRRRRRCLDRE